MFKTWDSLIIKGCGQPFLPERRVQTLALVWPETLMRSHRLSCALIEFQSTFT